MTSRVFGEWFATADMVGTPRVSGKVIFGANTSLIAIRSSFIFYNDPVFTTMAMRIYSNDNGAPGVLLSTSTNTLTKADILSLDNGDREIYFEFSNKPTFDGDDTYFLVPYIAGYTGTSSSHVAWKKATSAPIYSAGISSSYSTLLVRPYDFSLIGSTF